MPATYKILGITDDHTDCDCCGKSGLKKTVALDKGGVVRYFGTECAAKAMGLTKLAVEKGVRSATKAAAEAAERERANRANAEREVYDAWKLATFGDTRDSLERFRQYRSTVAV